MGISLPVGFSVSSAEAPGSGRGQLSYLRGHTSLVLADFAGPYVPLSPRVAAGAGASASLVLLGAGSRGRGMAITALLTSPLSPAVLLMFKAVGLLWGSTAGVSGATAGGRGQILASRAG